MIYLALVPLWITGAMALVAILAWSSGDYSDRAASAVIWTGCALLAAGIWAAAVAAFGATT